MIRITSLFIGFIISFSIYSQETKIKFNINFRGDDIGHIMATESKDESAHIRDLTTNSDAHVIAISVHVESEAKVTRNKGIVTEGIGYRHANRGSNDVHAHTQLIGDNKYEVKLNGKTQIKYDFKITWCVADLYFKEPKGVQKIFSNMYGDKIKIVHLKNGVYELITPDDKNSFYTYENGKLIKIETETPVGKVVSTRA